MGVREPIEQIAPSADIERGKLKDSKGPTEPLVSSRTQGDVLLFSKTMRNHVLVGRVLWQEGQRSHSAVTGCSRSQLKPLLP